MVWAWTFFQDEKCTWSYNQAQRIRVQSCVKDSKTTGCQKRDYLDQTMETFFEPERHIGLAKQVTGHAVMGARDRASALRAAKLNLNPQE